MEYIFHIMQYSNKFIKIYRSLCKMVKKLPLPQGEGLGDGASKQEL